MCERAASFPKNIQRPNIYEHRVDAYFERLNDQQGRIFRSEKAESAIDFWDFDVGGKGLDSSSSLYTQILSNSCSLRINRFLARMRTRYN